jgi:hypothetical protein
VRGATFDRPTRHGYSVKNLARQFHAKLARVRLFLRGALDTERTRELSEQMRVAGLASGSVTDLEQAFDVEHRDQIILSTTSFNSS